MTDTGWKFVNNVPKSILPEVCQAWMEAGVESRMRISDPEPQAGIPEEELQTDYVGLFQLNPPQ